VAAVAAYDPSLAMDPTVLSSRPPFRKPELSDGVTSTK